MSAAAAGAPAPRVCVVTGANKGLGLATVRRLLARGCGPVYLTARDEARGRAAVRALGAEGLHPHYHQLDVADRGSVASFRDHIRDTHGGIDILINNAAVANSVQLFNTPEENEEIVNINYKSILTVQELLFPLLRDHGRVLNISSDCGHLSNVRNEHWLGRFTRRDFTLEDVNEFVEWYLSSSRAGTFRSAELADGGTAAAYRVSKVALSAATVLQQRLLAPRHIAVNSLHPGLVRTDMTRGAGFLSPAEAARAPERLVLDAPDSLQGAYVWYDGRELDWYDHTADYYFKAETLKEGRRPEEQ